MQINVFQAFLIGLLYYAAQSTWFAGVGFYTLYRPLVNGFIVGLILGDPVQGTIVGASINLMYLGFISAGGALPGDPSMAGILGTALAISAGVDSQAAVALAVPLGILGTIVWVTRMTVDSVFIHWLDQRAEVGDINKIGFIHVIPAQILLLIITFIPVFLATLYGPQAVESALAFLGANVVGALNTVGGIMPALGIAMNLKAIFKGDNRIFFFLGFFLAVYLHLDIIAIALFGAIAAIVYMQINKDKGVVNNE
jgi:PTS system mannose-specific IIC component